MRIFHKISQLTNNITNAEILRKPGEQEMSSQHHL